MLQQEFGQPEEGQKVEIESKVPPRYVDPRLRRKFPTKKTDQPSDKSPRKLNWWKTFPFGTHIRETIRDIRIIRSSFARKAHTKQRRRRGLRPGCG